MSHSENPNETPSAAKKWQWIGPFIIAAAFIFMAAVSWRKWTDIVVDFGSQLYTAWQVSNGAVLYRDIIYVPGGPFSQYFNALLFKIFGVSIATLVWANLALTAGLLALLYRNFLKAADALTATTICLAIVLVFAFGYYDFNNFNYVTPYSHELFHGLILSVLAIVFLSKWVSGKKWRDLAAAGLCYGLAFLTKPDVFVALSAAIIAAIVLAKKNGRSCWPSFAILAAASLTAPLFFFIYFLCHEKVADSFRAVTFAWLPLTKGLADQYFYRLCLGLDRPGINIGYILTWSSGLILFLALGIIATRRIFFAAAAGILIFAAAIYLDWTQIGYALPLLSIVSCFFLWSNFWKQPAHDAPVFPMLWSIFALILLSKLGLFCRVWGYGFVLAMPAFAGGIYFLLWLFPSWLEKHGTNPRIFRVLIWAMLMCACVQLARTAIANYQTVNYTVGSGANEIKTASYISYPRGEDIADALAWLKTNAPPSATLAVVPEGATINFLSHRINPTGFLAWTPGELAVYGQTNLQARFEKNSPDYVILIQRSGEEFGWQYFGLQPEYGQAMMQWIRQNYELVFQRGAVPLQSGDFGLQILKRRPDQK